MKWLNKYLCKKGYHKWNDKKHIDVNKSTFTEDGGIYLYDAPEPTERECVRCGLHQKRLWYIDQDGHPDGFNAWHNVKGEPHAKM